ncbi:hypothetical protein JCM8097_003218 [Rhodosporidiobolus ruineniae]
MPPPVRRIAPLSLLLLGTGGSAAVPDIACTTSLSTGCACCLDTLSGPGRAGRKSKNIRGNTGAVLRIPPELGRESEGEKTVLVDCGKTFREQALKFFPKKGLRKIDACILTHHHADAIDGLDDLRAWTYHTAIESTIPIFCSRTTYSFIAYGFPYLVNKAAASGGGALPSFEWHIMPEDEDWEVCGVTITPVPAHHGHYFDKTPPRPLICLGFLFDQSVLYMSDASYIPETTWSLLSTGLSLPSPSGVFPSSAPSSTPTVFRPTSRSAPPSSPPLPRLQALIIDCNTLSLSPSHFGLPQAIATARRLGAKRTYFTDFPHGVSHRAWLAFSEAFERGAVSKETLAREKNEGRTTPPPLWCVRDEHSPGPSLAHALEGFDPHVEDVELFVERALEAVEEWAGGVVLDEVDEMSGRGRTGRWTRPAVDGMTIEWVRDDGGRGGREFEEESGRVWDDEYE